MAKRQVVSSSDRISGLPDNVIDNILSYLEINEAVKTSSLSKSWKEKWHTVPCIKIDDYSLRVSQEKMEGIISYILSQHKGKIQKFTLDIDSVRHSMTMQAWICRLLQGSIQELTLEIWKSKHIEMPCNLYSCQQLSYLRLRNFIIKPLYTFKGFQNLFTLHLRRITIARDVLESLIASCPLLENLVLKELNCDDNLNINVPNLKYLSFRGYLLSIHFNTPLLAVLSIDICKLRGGRFVIFDLPPAIKELDVQWDSREFFSTGSRLVEVSATYQHLKTLELGEFCFQNLEEVSTLLSLIESFPEVQTFDINIEKYYSTEPVYSHSVKKFWEERHLDGLMMNQLRYMTIRSFHGSVSELSFIQFVLASSPLLMELTIRCGYHLIQPETDVMVKLMHFRRASTEAEIRYIPSNHEREWSVSAYSMDSNSQSLSDIHGSPFSFE